MYVPESDDYELIVEPLTEFEATRLFFELAAHEYDPAPLVSRVMEKFSKPFDVFFTVSDEDTDPIFEDPDLMLNISLVKSWSASYSFAASFISYNYLGTDYIARILNSRFISILGEQVWYIGVFQDESSTPLRYIASGNFDEVIFGKKSSDEKKAKRKKPHIFHLTEKQMLGIDTTNPAYEFEGIFAEAFGEEPITPEAQQLDFFEMLDMEAQMQEKYGKLLQSVAVIHNHPNGSCMPSEDDIETTEKLTKAITKVRSSLGLKDHIIIGTDGIYFSVSGMYYPKEGHSIREKDKKRLAKLSDEIEKEITFMNGMLI